MEDATVCNATASGSSTEAAASEATESKGVSPSPKGSLMGYNSLQDLLQSNLPPLLYKEVSQLLLGVNCGKVVSPLSLPETVLAISKESSFDLQAYRFNAEPEMMRDPRIVRVGLIQNSIVLPTTAPFSEQRKAIMQRVKCMIEAAGVAGVNIICLQEAWTMPFAFCTREKRWCEFAESVDGESTQFLKDLAQKYSLIETKNMKATGGSKTMSCKTLNIQLFAKEQNLQKSGKGLRFALPILPLLGNSNMPDVTNHWLVEIAMSRCSYPITILTYESCIK